MFDIKNKAMARTALYALLFMVTSIFFQVVSGDTVSAAPVSYPTAANKYISVSNTGAGINLTAPTASVKMKFPSNANYFRIDVQDGYFRTGGIDSGVTSSGSTTFRICASNTEGEKDLNRCTPNLNPSGWSANQVIGIMQQGAAPTFAYSLNIPTIDGHKYLFLIAQHSGPGLNGFKVSYANGFTNPEMTNQASTPRIGFSGTQNSSGGFNVMSLVHLPLSPAGRSTYTLRFRLPCYMGSTPRFRLDWHDADRPPGGIPYDEQITWRIMNESSQTRHASDYAGGNLNNFLRGNNQSRSHTITDSSGFRVIPGQLITWQWTNVLNNNGVQFALPFSEADIDETCPPLTNNSQCRPFVGAFGLPSAAAGENIALADTSGNIIASKRVSPGQQVLLGVRFRNTGSSTWIGGFGVHALSTGADDITVASAPAPYNTWPVSNATNPKLVYFQNGTGETAPNQEVAFWFRVTLPSTFVNGQYTLSWRMRQTVAHEGRPVATFGGTCSITVREGNNRPYLTVHGGDVYSGARFGDTCEVTAQARSADIVTNGFSDDTEDANGPDPTRGSSMAQYAVFSSGIISSYEYNLFGNLGYVRPENAASQSQRDALFANYSSARYGYYYGNSDDTNAPVNYARMPCINEVAPTGTSTVSDTAAATSFVQSGEGARVFNGNLSLGSIAGITGRKTLYVSGNVTLQGPITYQSTYANADQIPYLKIVARNVYVQANAVTIDGHLVAMPSSTGTGGVLDTCSNAQPGPAGTWNTTMTVGYCRRTNPSFVVNGSLTARRVLWKRTYGTLGRSDEVINGECRYGAANTANRVNCSAELVNLNPEWYLAGLGSGSNISSVPINTVELTPIY